MAVLRLRIQYDTNATKISTLCDLLWLPSAANNILLTIRNKPHRATAGHLGTAFPKKTWRISIGGNNPIIQVIRKLKTTSGQMNAQITITENDNIIQVLLLSCIPNSFPRYVSMARSLLLNHFLARDAVMLCLESRITLVGNCQSAFSNCKLLAGLSDCDSPIVEGFSGGTGRFIPKMIAAP